MTEQKVTYATLTADENIHPEYEAALERTIAGFGQHHPLHIGEEETARGKLAEFAKTSPLDRRIIVGYFQKASAENVEEAVAAAKKSFEYWSRTSWKERDDIAKRILSGLDKEKFDLSSLMTYEVGKNRFEALAEVYEVMDFFSYYLRLIEEKNGFEGETKSPLPDERPVSVMRPYGVFAVVSPWNFPLMLLNNMAAGAFLTGNTVVMKPSSEAPLSAFRLYDIYRKAGVPAGVVNLVTGSGDVFGDEVTRNPDVAGLGFTGSRDVGMWLYREFTKNQPWPKPVIIEMGSKNPAIVSDKADLDKAATGVLRAAFGYQGQKCSAASRVYVQETVKDSFLEKLLKMVGELKVGDPRKRENFMGPVINQAALEKFRSSVQIAKASGGTVVFGGEVLNEGDKEHGYFVQPTVVTGLPPGHRLSKEELFVPILLISAYQTLDDAIREANDSEFGLTAGIFSEEPSEVDHFFDNIQSGVCYANRKGGATTGAWPGAQPFGGWKGSGSTGKGVGGQYYLLQFMREQSRTTVEQSS